MSRPYRFDVGVVGAGLVGLAVARSLTSRFTGISVLVLDKEEHVGAHQSSHNSGVVHSGLYYRPGSLKARLCVEGREEMYSFCEENGISNRRSGKIVVATSQSEVPALDELEYRGTANGLRGMRRLDEDGIREFEPHASGHAALHVPDAGVVDYPAVTEALRQGLVDTGVTFFMGRPVTSIAHTTEGAVVSVGDNRFSMRLLVNCAGLHSDRVAAMAGIDPQIRIVPFRGEYYGLTDQRRDLVKALIYPVPDPRFPFLGVHFTRRIDGSVEVGPNALLALGREHYRGTRPNWGDVGAVLTYPGFLRLAMRHIWAGGRELVNSRSTTRYAKLASLLVPSLSRDDLIEGGAGVRAQAVDSRGRLVDDFVIERAGKTLHVLNAPSPGATASLAIGRYIASELEDMI